ncbi:MAG: hypothetical protein WBX25_34760 [Rhodomicrobium sp.]
MLHRYSHSRLGVKRGETQNEEAPKQRRAGPDENIGSLCPCGRPKPAASVWWKLKFADGAVLYLSPEQFWLAGNCHIWALERLKRDFGIGVDDDGICAPFAFTGPDDGHVRKFLHAVMRLSIENYDRRPNPWWGSC